MADNIFVGGELIPFRDWIYNVNNTLAQLKDGAFMNFPKGEGDYLLSDDDGSNLTVRVDEAEFIWPDIEGLPDEPVLDVDEVSRISTLKRWWRWAVNIFSKLGAAAWANIGTEEGNVAKGKHASQHAQTGVDPITPAAIGAATPPRHSNLTIAASGWSLEVYALVDSLIVDGNTTGRLSIANNASDEQYAAWVDAKPRVVAQAPLTITIEATGAIPTIDLPVILEVWG